jgi:hypothetical protein
MMTGKNRKRPLGHKMDKFEEAVEKVFNKLYNMSEEEFRTELELHDGDIYQIILETKSLHLLD